jgi:ferrous-iron efflux pump FieF
MRISTTAQKAQMHKQTGDEATLPARGNGPHVHPSIHRTFHATLGATLRMVLAFPPFPRLPAYPGPNTHIPASTPESLREQSQIHARPTPFRWVFMRQKKHARLHEPLFHATPIAGQVLFSAGMPELRPKQPPESRPEPPSDHRPDARPIARRATLVTMATAFSLIALKLGVGLWTGSITVLASAVDSCLDFLVSTLNAVAVRQAGRPSDAAFNYGRGKLEGLAAFAEAAFILLSAAFIGYQAYSRFISPQQLGIRQIDVAIGVMLASLIVTGFLVAYLKRAANSTRNLILEADALHYRTDLLTGVGVLISLIAIRFTGLDWLDPAIGLALAVYIAVAAWPLLRKGLDQLLDRALDPGLVERIHHLAASHPQVNGVHEMRTRLAGDTYFVEFHLVLSESISLGKAHRISDAIENDIRALEQARWSINIHLDPVDDSHRDQKLRDTL